MGPCVGLGGLLGTHWQVLLRVILRNKCVFVINIDYEGELSVRLESVELRHLLTACRPNQAGKHTPTSTGQNFRIGSCAGLSV